MKILVCVHKRSHCRQDEIYLPVHVGRALSSDLGFTGDDTGENISHKNKSFCELTGIYWAWKNLKTDYIGLCHYRRYFYRPGIGREAYNLTEAAFKLVPLPNLVKYLKTYDIILPKKRVFHLSIWNYYAQTHYEKDLLEVEKIISELSPAYLNSFRAVIRRGNSLPHYNMFVMRWHEFDRYCKWLFSILFEAEQRINISDYNNLQQRIFGFIGERLLGVYVHHHQLKAKHLSIVFVNDEDENKSFFRYHASRWKSRLRFWIDLYSTQRVG